VVSCSWRWLPDESKRTALGLSRNVDVADIKSPAAYYLVRPNGVRVPVEGRTHVDTLLDMAREPSNLTDGVLLFRLSAEPFFVAPGGGGKKRGQHAQPKAKMKTKKKTRARGK